MYKNDKVIRRYSESFKLKILDELNTGKLNAFQVIFLSDFDENIKAYVNDKLVFEEYVKIGTESHSIENTFGYNYESDLKLPILKVESTEKGTCFDIEINKNYKIIYLFIDENGKWIVRFSNEYYLI